MKNWMLCRRRRNLFFIQAPKHRTCNQIFTWNRSRGIQRQGGSTEYKCIQMIQLIENILIWMTRFISKISGFWYFCNWNFPLKHPIKKYIYIYKFHNMKFPNFPLCMICFEFDNIWIASKWIYWYFLINLHHFFIYELYLFLAFHVLSKWNQYLCIIIVPANLPLQNNFCRVRHNL